MYGVWFLNWILMGLRWYQNKTIDSNLNWGCEFPQKKFLKPKKEQIN